MQPEYPILEYDPDPAAMIEPRPAHPAPDVPEHCVVCFFQDVIDPLVASQRLHRIATLRSEIGAHPVYVLAHNGRTLALFHPGVGAPLAAGLLEEAIALGCRSFVACGGAGVLDATLALGHIVIPTAAVRDEGTSYHYLPPSREVAPSRVAVTAIERVLRQRGAPYVAGKTWTTDAIYRETAAKVARRRAEGCLTVEMEAAAFFAVAQFRGVSFGQVLYGGDDLSGEQWDGRDWAAQTSVREALLWIAVEACLLI